MVCRRSLSLRRGLGAEPTRVLCERFQSYTLTPLVHALRFLNWAGTQFASRVPIVVSTVELWLALHGTDAVHQERQVLGGGLTRLHSLFEERAGLPHQIWLQDSVLKQEPRSRGAILTNECGTRPAVLGEDESQTSVMLPVKFGHALIVALEE